MIYVYKRTMDTITMKAKAITSSGKEITVHGTYCFGYLKFYNETDKEWIDEYEFKYGEWENDKTRKRSCI